ncbi:DUF4124 domain-containing protein [Tamilnaduibacter salinus]|uniref:DUF4124 domain-containing protein n=1 Tax=Tamilnaduibacter salinus TaxID=1484056 RepID=A0A2A2I1L0_9GAMM|nr:DUF4124 domain-containing protein [Tamilnaduibacter salinus]PAV25174.1 DUF4124 domain-containing protein [Tamilnaduibacter salinus]
MKPILLTMTAVFLMFSGHAAAESVYKWTDEDGVTHFGDRQPSGQQSESVDVKTGTSQSPGNRTSATEQVEALNEEKAREQEQQKQSRAEEARRKQQQKNCEIARENLNTLNTYSRIRVQGEDGEQRYLTPEEIEERKAKFQAVVEDSCNPDNGAQ